MELFAPYLTLRNAVLAAVLGFAFVIVRSLFKGPNHTKYTVPARCGSCGWVGTVSRYNATCPKCARAIGG